MGRLARQPHALYTPCAGRHSRCLRQGLYCRHPHGGRRGLGQGPEPCRRPGDRQAPGRRRAGRFPEPDPRPYRYRRGPVQGHPHPRHAIRAASGLCRRGACRHRFSHLPRGTYQRCGHRAPRDCRGQTRHGGHDTRPHRRPSYRAKNHAGARGRNPPLRRRNLLPGPHLRRRRGAVYPQRGDRARRPVAADHHAHCRTQAARGDCGRRAGRTGSGTCVCRARTPNRIVRSRRRTRRSNAAGRAFTPAR